MYNRSSKALKGVKRILGQVTKTLAIGDRAPLFALPDRNEKITILKDCAGSPIVLFFYASDKIADCSMLAQSFRDKLPEYEAVGAQILAISMDNPKMRSEFAQQNKIPFPLLSDCDLNVSKQYGVCHVQEVNGQANLIFSRYVFLLDRNLHLLKAYNPAQTPDLTERVLEDIKALFPVEEPRHISMQAPLLLIPNVITPDMCRHLIHVWETQGHDESGSMQRDGEKTIGVLDYSHKIRKDHFIPNQSELKGVLDRIMMRRVFPEI